MARGDLREALITAGMAALEAGEEPSLRAAARAAGVSAMAPYRHFADKEALVAAIADRGFALLHAQLTQADAAAGDTRAALTAQGMAYVAFAEANPLLFRLMFTGPHRLKSDEGGLAHSVLARRVAEIVPDDPAAGVLICWSTVHGLALTLLDGRLDPEARAAIPRTLALLVDALEARRR